MKQVILVNESLELPRGKLAAQVAHAAVAGFIGAPAINQRRWLDAGMPKVVLRAESESELRQLQSQARRDGVPVALIEDAGRTVVEPGTVTCVAIGPGEDETIDRITGLLKLVR